MSLHPIYSEFWESEERRLLAEYHKTAPGSGTRIAVSAFLQRARHMNKWIQDFHAFASYPDHWFQHQCAKRVHQFITQP